MDSKIAVIYKSRYGCTKKYAGWIALKLDADLYEVSHIRDKDLLEYGTIIYGGAIYQEKIIGINFIKKNYEKIKNKNIIIFMVGINEESSYYIDNILTKNISEDMKKNITNFYFRGDFDYKQLNIIDKVKIRLSDRNILAKNKEKSFEIKKYVKEFYNGPINLSNKKSIKDLINKNLGQV